jgi:molybdate/tungstate transport system ATP-binding protein
LDEPLSAPDSSFREEVRRSLKQLHQALKMTFLLVTHDFSEAIYLADRAAVISKGRLQQVGGVQEIFRYPANPFVANFVGMKNIFQADLDDNIARIGSINLILSNGDSQKHGTRILGIRPEDVWVRPVSQTPAVPNTFEGRVRNLEAFGMQFTINIDVMGEDIRAVVDGGRLMAMTISEGSVVHVCLPAEKIHIIGPPS